MSLDIYLEERIVADVYESNITHNLGKMADKAGIYECLWHPESLGINKAIQLIEPLIVGIYKLRKNPEYYKRFNSPNGWGVYEHFVQFVDDLITACLEHPNARVVVSI